MIDHEKVEKIIEEQANDFTLWFHPKHIETAVVQTALRRLHAAIERDWELVELLRIDND